MTRVGLVGGLGPESTIDYYRRILAAWAAEEPGTAPEVTIDSLDVQHALRLVATDRGALITYLLQSVRRLAEAGADFAVLTANTPHLVYDELTLMAPIPLLSIVKVCAEEASRRQLTRLGLLGTRFTMEAPFYPSVFRHRGLTIVTPDAVTRDWVHQRYLGELLRGDFRDTTRAEFELLIERWREVERIDGVVLGGTELPLLLPGDRIGDLPVLDTTALHVAAIVTQLRQAPPRRGSIL